MWGVVGVMAGGVEEGEEAHNATQGMDLELVVWYYTTSAPLPVFFCGQQQFVVLWFVVCAYIA